MAQYNYDETGAIFNFFMLTLLTFFLLPFSFYVVFGKTSTSTTGIAKKKSVFSGIFKWILFLAGWGLFAFFLYRATTMSISDEVWDPYEILGVDSSANETVVKKAFKRLSLKYHPDKVEEEKKEEAAKLFVEISKAYKVLTDEEARKIFDEFGHPDGKQAFELGLALPKWLVEKGNASFVLLVYGALFGVGLPFVVARWWSSAKKMTKTKVLNQTMAIFYRDLKETLGFKALVEILARAEEFKSIVSMTELDQQFDELANLVKNAMDEHTSDRYEKKKNLTTSVIEQRVVMILYAHMLRIPYEQTLDAKLTQEIKEVVAKAIELTKGMLQLTTSRGWLSTSAAIIELNQLLIQAVYYHQSQLLQLPHLTTDMLKHFHTKKRNISSIQRLLALDSTELKSLLRSLDQDQFDALVATAKKYPVFNVTKADFSVEGEPVITPGAIVTLTVKLNAVYGGEPIEVTSEDEEEEDDEENKWWEDKSADQKPAYAPYLPAPLKPLTWVILANASQNRMICLSKIVGLDGTRTAKLKFQAPPQEGSWNFQLFIKSDCYLGIDQTREVKLTVSPASAAPPIPEEDDISEPDENTLAGQVAAAKKGVKPAHERGEYDDSSDSDDDPDPKKRAQRRIEEEDEYSD